MTEQYQQTNINQPMSGARYVDQNDIETDLTPDAVPLNADDEFVIASDFDDVTAYQINLPDVREVEGKDVVIKARLVPPIAIVVTIGTADGTGQTIDGAATVLLGAAGNCLVVRADPPDFGTTPPTAPTNWSIVRTGAP